MKNDTIILIAFFVCVSIVAIVGLALTGIESEFTCPDWGDVPVVINGEDVCISWDQIIELEPSQ